MKRAVAAICWSCAALSLAACVTTAEPGAQTFASPEEARLVSLARDIESRGEPGTALALYERAAEVAPQSPGAHVRLGEARLKAGDTRAGDAFRAALAIEPNHPQALMGLGMIELNNGEVEKATERLAAAAPLVKTASAYNRLGTALVLSGRPAEAKAAYAQARQLDPQNVDMAANVALAESLAGEHEAAIARMRAIAQSPLAKPRHQRNLIVVLALAGRAEEAQAVTVADLPPRQKSALVARAKKLAEIKDPSARARAVGLMAGA